MEVEISGCIQKSGAQTLTRNISKTIRVRQTIYTAFKRRASGLSDQFLNCWAGDPLARAPCAQSFLRVVSLTAVQLVSKHARAPLT